MLAKALAGADDRGAEDGRLAPAAGNRKVDFHDRKTRVIESMPRGFASPGEARGVHDQSVEIVALGLNPVQDLAFVVGDESDGELDLQGLGETDQPGLEIMNRAHVAEPS